MSFREDIFPYDMKQQKQQFCSFKHNLNTAEVLVICTCSLHELVKLGQSLTMGAGGSI